MNSQGRPISYETATEVVYGMDYNVYKKEFQLPATDEQLALFESTKANHAVHEELPPPPEPLAVPAAPPAPMPEAAKSKAPTSSRKSAYPMTDVDDALAAVLEHTRPLPTEQIAAAEATGRVLAEDVAAAEPLPPFAASILDGYAVVASDGPGDYPVVGRVVAGSDPKFTLEAGQIAYITTGAKLPPGADAIVKYEDTEMLHEEHGEERLIRILKGASGPGKDVRAIGVDIAQGSRVLAAPTVLSAADVGLCASVGASAISVVRRPVVGVMSTGDELLSPEEVALAPGMIRDANRATLLSWASTQIPADVVDLGIAADTSIELEEAVAAAASRCDVILTSGGVSMGEADLLKQVLLRLGAVIPFGRLNMKPGKPTTFAVLGGESPCLVFALPGNPVSCLVTAHLLAAPALRRLSGLPVAECMHPQVNARLREPLAMDPERPEYHRCQLKWEGEGIVAESTGVQRSSRLLSMVGANALVVVPQGSGAIPVGSLLPALMIGDLAFHRRAAGVHPISTAPPAVASEKPLVRVCVLTCSDRASRGEYVDETGPAVQSALSAPEAPIQAELCGATVVPDEADRKIIRCFSRRLAKLKPFNVAEIAATVLEWCGRTAPPDLILTAGGTGFTRRDVTPEAVAPLLERDAPGIVHALLGAAAAATESTGGLGLISRPVAGTRGGTLIVTLPGSPRAAQQQLAVLLPLLPRLVRLMQHSL